MTGRKDKTGKTGKTGGAASGAAPGAACPLCGRPAAAAHRPFCSRRCADLDLGLWLKGAYRIPAVEPPDSLAEGDPAAGEGAGDGPRDEERG